MPHLLHRFTLAALVLTAGLLAPSRDVRAETKNYTATAPDGVTLAIQEAGAPQGSPLIVIHGRLANAALASWDMQREVPAMTVDTAGLAGTHKPVLLLYGAQDALAQAKPMVARAEELNPRVQSKLYADSGHAPFLEEPERFNRDLAGFVMTTDQK